MKNLFFRYYAVVPLAVILLITSGWIMGGEYSDSDVEKENEELNVFFIKRSMNKNEFHYDARVNKDCTWNRSDPIDAYWHNLENGQGDCSEILIFEQIGYGYSVKDMSEKKITIEHTALSNYPITATLSMVGGKCSVSATVNIKPGPNEKQKKAATLQSVYVYMDEGIIFNTPTSADILCYSKGSKRDPVYENHPYLNNPKSSKKPKSIYWESGVERYGRCR